MVIGKSFNDLDFTAIKRFKSSGIPVYAVTGDEWNHKMLNKRQIQFFLPENTDGILDKSNTIFKIIDKYAKDYGITVVAADIIYVGDDVYDMSMRQCQLFCPQNAAKSLKEISTIINQDGGKGVIAKLWDTFEEYFDDFVYPYDNL